MHAASLDDWLDKNRGSILNFFFFRLSYKFIQLIRVKRVYDLLPSGDDGYRILVDRLWPRGLAKSEAEIDAWTRDIAPSNGLRRWFGHRPERWDRFKARYFQELAKKEEIVQEMLAKEKAMGTLTLLYGSKEPRYNNAIALKEYLEER